MAEDQSEVAQFIELYGVRESLRLQLLGATATTAAIYDQAISNASEQLTQLAQSERVRAYLMAAGGSALRSQLELERIKSTGLVDEALVDQKEQEILAALAEPAAKMAAEFINIDELPEAPAPVRRRTASEKQVNFAQRLGLEVDSSTPRGIANKMITQEVKRRGRAELRSGWALYDDVIHPRHGICEIVKIHEKSVKVTLEPVAGGRKIVVNAMNLGFYKRPE